MIILCLFVYQLKKNYMGVALELKQEIDKVIQLKLIAESNIMFSEM